MSIGAISGPITLAIDSKKGFFKLPRWTLTDKTPAGATNGSFYTRENFRSEVSIIETVTYFALGTDVDAFILLINAAIGRTAVFTMSAGGIEGAHAYTCVILDAKIDPANCIGLLGNGRIAVQWSLDVVSYT
jgi:hypothetical protein